MRYLIVILTAAVVLLPLTANATEIGPGPVYGDWYSSGNPYNVNGEINVPVDSTLNIHEGVEVIFQGHYKFLVYGYLEANGTESDSILFTAADTTEGWHGIRFINAQDNSHLSYCIIQHGKATGVEPDSWGGGIYCEASSPVISHCTIRWNWASVYHGGISCSYSSSPSISDCSITQNSAQYSGGIGCWFASDVTISHCTISENSTDVYGGGGVALWYSNATISYCTISGNSAPNWNCGGLGLDYSSAAISYCNITGNSAGMSGGGITCYYANAIIESCTISDNSAGGYSGGISCSESSPTIESCTITGNTAVVEGGGIFCGSNSNATIESCTITQNSARGGGGGISCWESSPTIINNSISLNSAALNGGGINCYGSSPTIINNSISLNSAALNGGGINCYGSSPTIINNSISLNSAALNGGGINCENYSYPTITNTVFWADIAPQGPEIYLWYSSPTVTYCDVQGGWPGTGNIDADPIFVGPYNEDFHLRWHSPCIDAGDPDPSYNDPDGTRNDMGAFYFNQDVDGIVEVYPLGEPIVIPPEGGDIIYDGWVFNFFGHAGRVDIWTYAFVPEMGRYGPIDLYENVRIPADSLGRNGITEHVPGIAPEGDYVFVAYVGDYPGSIIDSSCFYFTKTGSVAGGIADWQSLKGWFDGDFLSKESGLPSHYALSQNYPNPFNATTVINYQLPADGFVKLEVYNTLGQKVATLLDSRQQAGYRSVLWDASTVSSGLYLYKLTAGDFTETRRMMLVK